MDKQCYFPDGTVSPYDMPCNATAPVSACCNEEANCLGNGLCSNGLSLSRGSCTTTDWLDSACVQECQEYNPSGGVVVQLCDQTSDGVRHYACMVGVNNCPVQSASGNLFTLETAASTVLFRPTQLAEALNVAGYTSEAAVISVNVTSSVATATEGTQGTTLGVATPTAATTASGGSASTAMCSAVAPAKAMYTSTEMAGVGVGIGAPLALALAAAILLLRRERKRGKRPHEGHTAMGGQNKPDTYPAELPVQHRCELPDNGLREL